MALSLPSERQSARLRATAGVVDIWGVDLTAVEDGLEELLCAQERARAQRVVRARSRTLWVRSRGVLRMLLGRYLDRDPRELRFALGPHGKPALGGDQRGAPDLHFNLSHSGELALVAVTAERKVGVDVERVRARYTTELLRAWTVREATVKCLGTGLASAPDLDEGDAPDDVWTAELDIGPRAVAAVTVEGSEACELRCRDSAPTLAS